MIGIGGVQRACGTRMSMLLFHMKKALGVSALERIRLNVGGKEARVFYSAFSW